MSAPPPAGDAHGNATIVVASDHRALLQHLSDLATRRHLKLVQPAALSSLVATCAEAAPVLIVLDASLDSPVMWTALGHLKQDSRTRHIAVHVLCHPSQKQRALRLGAASYTLLPLESTEVLVETVGLRLDRLTQPQRYVLVVEDDDTQRGAILDLIGNGDIKARGAATAAQALEVLTSTRIDCVVLDLGLPDMDGTALIGQLNERLGEQCPPIIVYTARMLPREQELELMRNAQALIVKGAHSPERLIDELTLLLSRWPSRLSPATRALIDRSRQHDPVLAGHKILVVDDDVRNIFAISAALETYGATVVHAESGLDGIAVLQGQPDVSLALMDVMMPNIDGLETIRRIRALPEFAELPIIAVTAKAMPGDRDNCLAAGASDYLSKPVDMDHLRAMIRVWLAR
ncbi:MAG: response regulator [Rubrivivax sp.]|nr:MAG: response regulator [Rubrivivax sp.]